MSAETTYQQAVTVVEEALRWHQDNPEVDYWATRSEVIVSALVTAGMLPHPADNHPQPVE